MNNPQTYFELLNTVDIDPEYMMSILEKQLEQTKGEIHTTLGSTNRRCFILENHYGKLANYANGTNFEIGLKNLFENVYNFDTFASFKNTRWSNKPSSNIDSWILGNNKIEIRQESGENGFIIGTSKHNPETDKTYIFEMRAPKLITALEYFHQYVPQMKIF